MSWLAKIFISVEDALKNKISDSYSWHKKLWDCFPALPEKKRDFLTRIDTSEGFFRIWLLSQTKPSCPAWCRSENFNLKEIAPQFLSHKYYAFDLQANAIKTISLRGTNGETLYNSNGKRKRGKRVPIVKFDELSAWIKKKGLVRCRDNETGDDVPGGFRIIEERPLEIRPMAENFFRKVDKKNGTTHYAYHGSVQFRGTLEVTNQVHFRATYCKGIGSAKGFGLSEEETDKGAQGIIEALVKIDKKSKDKVKSTTLYFMSPLEIETLSKAYAETKDVKKALKEIDAKALKDASDISLFGRMVANDHSLTVEAASMFSHALSTHKVDNEIDFFSAVDDLQTKEDAGAGMTSTLEFNSATYYRFTGLNLDMLADDEHLGCMTKDERVEVVKTFLEATVKAIPSARKNTMNGNTLPNYVLGIVREKGHPIQLVNAFENPVRSARGYAEKSIELLKNEYSKLKDTWDIQAVFEKAIPEVGINEILDGMVTHVI